MFIYSKILLILLLVGAVAFADNLPTVHQVYETAKTGDLAKAHSMIEEVLKAHPDSAKAHFVDAEILSRQGNLEEAKNELKKARQIEPGLSFAKPQAVQKLERSILETNLVNNTNEMMPRSSQTQKKSFPWIMIIVLFGAGLIIVLLIKSSLSRKQNSYTDKGNNQQNAPTRQNLYGNNPSSYPPQQPQNSGIGSTIATGLAAGAAAGVGMVAGEALMHHFMDGPSNTNNSFPDNRAFNNNQPAADDADETDFGINDNSSWDDDSNDSSGDDNW